MSDEAARPSDPPAQRERVAVLGHVCEHAGGGEDAGWGFARPRQPSHWFCFEHRGEGEKLL